MNNYVILKGKRDRLVIHLNNEVDFLTLRDSLVTKIREASAFIGDVQMAIEFNNRKLSEMEENVLIDLIKNNSNLNISYVFSENIDDKRERIKFIKAITEEGLTKFYKGTLRSGNKLEYDGNIVILGDVNPGAFVKAKGNVIVLGFLNGTVYAGQGGDKEAFVGALHMNPVQLVIGGITAPVMQREILETNKVDRNSNFKMALIKDNKIIVEDFNSKLLNS